MVNLGNTCYMNATLQTMRAIPELQTALTTYTPPPGLDGSFRYSSPPSGCLFITPPVGFSGAAVRSVCGPCVASYSSVMISAVCACHFQRERSVESCALTLRRADM